MRVAIIALYNYGTVGQDAWLDFGAGMTYTATKHLDVDFIDLCAVADKADLESRLVGYDLVAFGLKSSYYQLAMEVIGIAKAAGSKVMVAGVHTVAAPQELLSNEDIDYIFYGESEITFPDFIQHPENYGREIHGEVPLILDDLPFMERDMFQHPVEDACGWLGCTRMTSVLASRGCAYKCLTGDTPIHTIDGEFAIRDLVGKNTKVLSRNPVTQEPVYAEAINIRKTQSMAKLVRVHFDDGTHIDCTPDHKFKVFKSKNQYIEESEWDVEAKDLKPKQQVRAVRFDTNKTGRVSVSTRRNITRFHARVVMEASIGRTLLPHERIHHRDTHQGNDTPSNLVLTDKNNHTSHHPEIAERMRLNNPVKNMTPEWREKLRLSSTGKTRSLAQRLRYRESKLGEKNPLYKASPKRRRNYSSRIKELDVNHKVIKVETLTQRQDVYCMEVPGINWFYANKVLVHNCRFCQPLSKRHFGTKLRRRSVGSIIDELTMLKAKYSPEFLMIHDDTFLVQPLWLEEFIQEYPKIGLPFWASGRADGICQRPELVKRLVNVGWKMVSVGFESGSQRVLDMVGKGTTVEQNLSAARIIKETDAVIYGNFMLGFPTETHEEVMQTMRMADEIHADLPSWAFFSPYPGNSLGEECIEKGLSLLSKFDYNRYPHNEKIIGVDYAYLRQALGGLRE